MYGLSTLDLLYAAAIALAAIALIVAGAVALGRSLARTWADEELDAIDAHIEDGLEPFILDWRWPSHTPEVAL